MPKTIEQQAIEAFQTALVGIATSPTVYLDREKPIAEADLPAINTLALGSERLEFNGHGVDAHDLKLVVAMYDKAGTGETPTELLSTLRGDVRQAIAADETLGGLVVDVNETDCDIDAADLDGAPKAAASAIAYAITYWTRPGDPYTAGP